MALTSASAYSMMSHHEHITNVTDTYIGSDEQVPRETRVLHFTEGTPIIRTETITLPEGVERLFIEVLSNSSDNVDRSRRANVHPGEIKVSMNSEIVSIRNGGLPIPIELHPQHKVYAPQLIFGNLLTSSNYNKEVDRTGCGRNGYGAKLVNIFSQSFQVRVGDSERGLEYCQVWQDGMKTCHPPQVAHYRGDSYVEITWRLNFQRFGYTQYPQEAMNLFARHCAETALMMKVPVYFNGVLLDYQNPGNYVKSLFGTECNYKTITIYPVDAQLDQNGRPVDLGVMPESELSIVDTPDCGMFISSVNGMMTPMGGVHLEGAYSALSDAVLTKLAQALKLKDDSPKLTKRDVRAHLSIVLICNLRNPKFDAQTKMMLKSPTPKFEIPEAVVKKMLSWDFVDRLNRTMEMKSEGKLSKTDGRKSKHVNVRKAIDANQAGTKSSMQCSLFITEGDSAMGYATTLRSIMDDGRAYNNIGIFPMKGKPLNVMNAGALRIAQNTEIIGLKEMLGLREGVDYSNNLNFNTLRYGRLIIMADSDEDGKHIVGLVLNIFHCRYPSLLQRGYVYFMRTPILRLYRGKEVLKFYTKHQYKEWKKSVTDADKWEKRYFKGLGSSDEEEVRDDYKSLTVVLCNYDQYTPYHMELAFDNKKAPARKDWVAQYKEVPGMEGMQYQHITHFMNHEFITYAIANIARSIPRFIDGLKTSQRKAIWASILKFKRKPVKKTESFKVSRFSGYIADVTDYAHGETCMADTIVKMAQNYTGSNNIPYFTRDGQFGTRFHNGDDAGSSRYISCRPELLIPYIFRQEDDAILKFDKSEGMKVEPREMYPIVPLSLINGASGIGTAWSTYVCNHDPRVVVDHILKLLDNPEHQVPYLTPWYRGYTGSIELVVKNKKREEARHRPTLPGERYIPEDFEGDDIFYNEDDAVTVKITGRFHQVSNDITIVTEIPVGKSFESYKTWLEALLNDGEIEDFENLSTDSSALFIIKGFQSPTLESLRLVRRIGTSNMVFLDSMGTPSEYMNTPLILNQFVTQRLQKYQERKDSIITDIEGKIKKKEDRRAFIKYVLDGTISFKGVKLSELRSKVQSLGLPTELVTKVTVSKFTEEEIALLEANIEQLYKEKQSVIDTSIQSMWKKDLDEFMKQYDKIYGEDEANPDYIHVSKISRAMENINAGTLVHKKSQKRTKKKSNVIVS